MSSCQTLYIEDMSVYSWLLETMNGFLSYSSEFTKYCDISLVWRKNDAFRMRQSLGECIEVPSVRKLGVHTFCGDVISKESFARSN